MTPISVLSLSHHPFSLFLHGLSSDATRCQAIRSVANAALPRLKPYIPLPFVYQLFHAILGHPGGQYLKHRLQRLSPFRCLNYLQKTTYKGLAHWPRRASNKLLSFWIISFCTRKKNIILIISFRLVLLSFFISIVYLVTRYSSSYNLMFDCPHAFDSHPLPIQIRATSIFVVPAHAPPSFSFPWTHS
ncbi:hypothetical protein BGW80DRAFT_549387 [Lactifluus volemus]|nr:hypothetical protein BGW80DRAFT_549387 [Lactifluus volemus]